MPSTRRLRPARLPGQPPSKRTFLSTPSASMVYSMLREQTPVVDAMDMEFSLRKSGPFLPRVAVSDKRRSRAGSRRGGCRSVPCLFRGKEAYPGNPGINKPRVSSGGKGRACAACGRRRGGSAAALVQEHVGTVVHGGRLRKGRTDGNGVEADLAQQGFHLAGFIKMGLKVNLRRSFSSISRELSMPLMERPRSAKGMRNLPLPHRASRMECPFSA